MTSIKSEQQLIDLLIDGDHLWIFDNARSVDVIHDVLDRYLSPHPWQISRNRHGKPQIETRGPSLFFNLSHSGSRLVLVVSLDEVGVDIEEIKSRKFLERLRRRYFPDDDGTTLLDFYRSWTAREAFIKSIGSALWANISTIQIVQAEEEILIGMKPKLSHVVRYLELEDNYLVAVCKERLSTRKPLLIFK